MKTICHSFLYCCLLASVAHCVELEVNPELKKRLSIWLGSRLRRELESIAAEKTSVSENFVRPEDIRDTLLPHTSTDVNIRTKRSKGCALGTCAVHDLAHRIQQLNHNRLKTGAPADKMSPQGYGRRRRSVPERRVSLRMENGRLRPMWRLNDSQIHKLEALLRRT
ncbi:hypothetical protein ATANTOWER_006569 [Ataeniobius toweri]|uniref:Adrenomedullin a n=1 Tax=Ataeniobius toweri TaxID=208326 RepID=A0ABU7B552_9TELE|nr:hypothetical protein [Ataeniobius toweri]